VDLRLDAADFEAAGRRAISDLCCCAAGPKQQSESKQQKRI